MHPLSIIVGLFAAVVTQKILTTQDEEIETDAAALVAKKRAAKAARKAAKKKKELALAKTMPTGDNPDSLPNETGLDASDIENDPDSDSDNGAD